MKSSMSRLGKNWPYLVRHKKAMFKPVVSSWRDIKMCRYLRKNYASIKYMKIIFTIKKIIKILIIYKFLNIFN